MRRLLTAALIALAPLAAQAQEPSNSIFLPSTLAPSGGLKQGWNSLAPSYCYGFAHGADIIVKLSANNDAAYIQSRNSTVHNAMMLACASQRVVWVYSSDGYTWEGMFLSALQ
jgi:hypothetical protein